MYVCVEMATSKRGNCTCARKLTQLRSLLYSAYNYFVGLNHKYKINFVEIIPLTHAAQYAMPTTYIYFKKICQKTFVDAFKFVFENLRSTK